MSILSGFKKVRRHIRLPDGYKQLSFWTSSQTVEMDDGTTLESNKTKWDDKYTKTEIDNKMSAIETNIDWKESVDTFSDITKTYLNPQDGWTVNVKDTDYTYRYNGNEWVAISANAIPKATNNVDGLLTKEDHTRYEDAVVKKHEHSNKEVLDSITSEKVSKWNALTESNVTGVKGNAESVYRTGNINLTPANIGALPTTGGTLTGNISYNMNSSTQIPLKVYGGDANGQGVSVGAGGATIVGAGESAKSCESLLSATAEQLWLTSDTNIYFYTNCNTIGSRVGAVLDTSRQFYPTTNNTGSIGTSAYKWANVYTNSFNGTALSSNGLATSSTAGLTKLYTSTGTSTDGTMTRKSITEALALHVEKDDGIGQCATFYPTTAETMHTLFAAIKMSAVLSATSGYGYFFNTDGTAIKILKKGTYIIDAGAYLLTGFSIGDRIEIAVSIGETESIMTNYTASRYINHEAQYENFTLPTISLDLDPASASKSLVVVRIRNMSANRGTYQNNYRTRVTIRKVS